MFSHFQTEITSVEFSRKTPGKLLGGYRYKPVEPYLLPKGFEGILQVENLSDGHVTLHVTSRQVQVKVNVGGGVLRLVQVRPLLCYNRLIHRIHSNNY